MGVMNVKRGATNSSHTSSGIRDNTSTLGSAVDAADFKKAYGDQDMGQVLNKVADPNWIDPTKKARGVGNAELGKDAFMKMMLAQMKNQDPTNPTPSHEMAAQLAQFSSLEQLSNINTSIEGLKQATAPSSNYQALAFIGKKVSGDGAMMTRVKGDTKHEFSFDLMGDAMKAKITVKDAAGNLVRTLNATNLKKGSNTIEWNGLQEDGTPARAGEYRFAIEASSSSGQKVYAKTGFEGRITGMNFGADGPILMVGKKQVRMSEVKKIEEMGPEEAGVAATGQPIPLKAGGSPLKAGALNAPASSPMQDAMAKAALSMAPGKKVAANQTPSDAEIPPAEDVDPSKMGNIADIPMAQGMLNKLEKELK